MKKNYETPEMRMLDVECGSIICQSTGGDKGGVYDPDASNRRGNFSWE